MSPTDEPDLAHVLRAAQFAADKHRYQKRKGETGEPYVNHPIQVACVLSSEVGVTDPAVLCAALLHDTLEDTDATREELAAGFGAAVADIVAEVSDDPLLPKPVQKAEQILHARRLSHRARLVRLADKVCNVRDMLKKPPSWPIERRLSYLDWSEAVVAGIRGTHPGLEALFDEALAQARTALWAERS